MSPAERRRALNAGAVVIRFTEYISLLIDLHRTTGHAEDVPHSFGWLRGTRSGYPAMA
jgi:hypothetical protein